MALKSRNKTLARIRVYVAIETICEDGSWSCDMASDLLTHPITFYLLLRWTPDKMYKGFNKSESSYCEKLIKLMI